MNKLVLFILILLSFINLKAQTTAKKQFPVGEKCKSVMNELTDLHKQTVKFFNEKTTMKHILWQRRCMKLPKQIALMKKINGFL